MTAPLFSYAELLAVIRGRPINPAPGEISGVSIDSRSVAPGEAFFAIKGDALDGHDYVGRALAAGAATAVVAEAKLPALGRITGSMTVVADVLSALGDLGRAARARSHAAIVAVTGSAGKTTTKEMLLHMLGRQGLAHGAAASFNNHWGVPLTLARMPPEARFGVFEIGMNHAGEITPLTAMVRPHVAVITNVEAVHLAHFDNVADIARAKAEIFLGIEPGGSAVVNRDNPHFELLWDLARTAGVDTIVSFGTHPDADVRLEEIVLGPETSLVAARILGADITYSLGAPGRHLVDNSLAALAAVGKLGADVQLAANSLADMAAVKGRGQRRRLRVGDATALLIDESYNANPASMRAAINLLEQSQPIGGGRRIAVLGDMLELGATEADLHAALAKPLISAAVDQVFLAGSRMAALWEELPIGLRGAYAPLAADLLPSLIDEIQAGDVVMVKGSNGSRMGPLVEALSARFGGQVEANPGRAGPGAATVAEVSPLRRGAA